MRWIEAKCFEAMASDLPASVRLVLGRNEQPESCDL